MDLRTLPDEQLDAYIAEKSWTAERIAATVAQHEDHAAFCRRLTIRNKEGIEVPVIQTPAQTKLTAKIESIRRRGKPVRVVALKARQVHMSVACATHGFKLCAFLPGQKGYVFTNRQDTTEQIFTYYQQFVESYDPEGGGVARLAVAGLSKGNYIRFDAGGELTFGTAGSAGVGRGSSRRFLHLSEVAFWPKGNAAPLRTGLFQTVPDDPDTMIIEESTANGKGGAFYDSFWRAYDPAGDSDWEWLFYAWWEHPEYVLPVADPARFQDSLSREEQDLRRLHSLSLEQLHWRRWAIANKCEGSVKRFCQEFPASPEEAFLTSGRPYFDLRALSRMPLIRTPLVGHLKLESIGTREQFYLEEREDGRGELRVWRKPEKGECYVIGADAAGGVDVGQQAGTESDPDFAVAQVLSQRTGEQVACLRERLSPGEFGYYLFDLARWYNGAFIVPEANNHGVATIQRLLDLDIPLQQIYLRERAVDDRRPPQFHEYGFRTDTRTRPQLIAALAEAIREQAIYIRDPLTLDECQSFVYLPDGKVAAAPGCHDDTVLALALAVMGLRVAPHRTVAPRVGNSEVLNAPPGALRLSGLSRRALAREVVNGRGTRVSLLR
jgi:hypothetical protein